MGLAIDTILYNVDTPGATFTPAANNGGDPAVIRNFPTSAFAKLEQVIRRHATAGAVRLLSPLLHDDVTGMTFYTSETPSVHNMPPPIGQPVQPGDQITVQVTGDTTNQAVVALVYYYSDLSGASAQLMQWGDVVGRIKAIKPMTVAVAASGTVGEWSDTPITTTENQLHATSYYAVLGYITDAALAVVGIKSQSTGNLRVCGPGYPFPEDTSTYFVDQSQRMGTPHIPVFNGQDRAAVSVSVADDSASTTANITLVLAELSGQF